MYKVFIDHKPVIFTHNGKINGNAQVYKAKKVKNFHKEINGLLKNVSIDMPLYLVSSNPEKVFKNAFAEHYFIEAAGGLVIRKDKFLLIKRKGLWDIPKGKIDKGESPEEAGVREVCEECGIEGPVIHSHLVDTYHTMKYRGKPALKKTYWYIMRFDGKKRLSPQTEEGITEVKWVSEKDMLAIRGNTFGSINEVIDAFVAMKLEA